MIGLIVTRALAIGTISLKVDRDPALLTHSARPVEDYASVVGREEPHRVQPWLRDEHAPAEPGEEHQDR